MLRLESEESEEVELPEWMRNPSPAQPPEIVDSMMMENARADALRIYRWRKLRQPRKLGLYFGSVLLPRQKEPEYSEDLEVWLGELFLDLGLRVGLTLVRTAELVAYSRPLLVFMDNRHRNSQLIELLKERPDQDSYMLLLGLDTAHPQHWQQLDEQRELGVKNVAALDFAYVGLPWGYCSVSFDQPSDETLILLESWMRRVFKR